MAEDYDPMGKTGAVLGPNYRSEICPASVDPPVWNPPSLAVDQPPQRRGDFLLVLRVGVERFVGVFDRAD
jgi:hypothetical protein